MLADGGLPVSGRYIGCDISPVMLRLAAERLAPCGQQTLLIRTGSPLQFLLGKC